MDISKLPKGIYGQFYDTSNRTCLSMTAEDFIPFGFPLMRGSDKDRGVKVFSGAIFNECIGISAYNSLEINSYMHQSLRPQGGYKPDSTVTVLRHGKIWVPIFGAQDIKPGDEAYIDPVDDKITNIYAPDRTIAIGKFLTGGVATTAGTPFAVSIFGLQPAPDADLTLNAPLKNDKSLIKGAVDTSSQLNKKIPYDNLKTNKKSEK